MKSSDPSEPVRAVLDTDRGRRAREASAWLVRLSESPDDAALKAGVERWCAESVLNREAWQHACITYGRLGAVPAAHRPFWEETAQRGGNGPRTIPAPDLRPPIARAASPAHPVWRRRRSIAAAIALAACLAFVAGPSLLIDLQADYATSTAESLVVKLDDGSQVRLAPRSALQVAFSSDERRTRLLRGEAFFDVAGNLQRPFTVAAGDVVTTVLGTAFDVRLDESGATVAVQRGRVRVTAPAASPPVAEQLDSGETLQVSAEAPPARTTIAPEDVGAWQTGMFVARARPIGEIVDALRRYHDGAIVVRDDAFLSRRVSGAHDLRTPEATLRGLASAHDAVVRQVTPWLLIVTAR